MKLSNTAKPFFSVPEGESTHAIHSEPCRLPPITEQEFLRNPVASIVYEEDPNGIDQHAPGAKLDSGKPMGGLLIYFGRALLSVAEVGTYGANKYTRGGWQFVPDGFNRYTDALLRHLLKEDVEDYDPESELLHAAHSAWNALARLELLLRKREVNTNLHTTDTATRET